MRSTMGGTSLAKIDCIFPAAALLGESPVWCPADNALYWVDIKRPAIHRFNPITAVCQTWHVQDQVASIALRRSGGAIAALRCGLAYFDFQTGAVCRLFERILHEADMRFNDGRCDRSGRFWVGTLHEARHAGTAALYRFEPDGRCTKVITGVTVSNGIAWSPDNRTMYFADSWTRTIFSFDFDLDSGTLHKQRIFVQLPSGSGVPDGATVDAEGCLWSANFDGGCITRYTPDGSVDRTIRMPVQRPTSCVFGGKDLGTLFVTSASLGLTDQQRREAPLAGGLFAVDVGVKGLPEPRFGG
jgi:L-arabinonolactonase